MRFRISRQVRDLNCLGIVHTLVLVQRARRLNTRLYEQRFERTRCSQTSVIKAHNNSNNSNNIIVLIIAIVSAGFSALANNTCVYQRQLCRRFSAFVDVRRSKIGAAAVITSLHSIAFFVRAERRDALTTTIITITTTSAANAPNYDALQRKPAPTSRRQIVHIEFWSVHCWNASYLGARVLWRCETKRFFTLHPIATSRESASDSLVVVARQQIWIRQPVLVRRRSTQSVSVQISSIRSRKAANWQRPA